MDLTKFRPSSWFKHEEPHTGNVPVQRRSRSLPSLDAFHSEIDKVFDSFFQDLGPWSALPSGRESAQETWLKPSLDLKATDTAYQVSVELPGVNEKDITVELENGVLIISGEKKSEAESKDDGQGYYRMERRYGSFRRMLALPGDVDGSGVSASFTKGVLKIDMPRKEARDVKRIAIAPEKN